MEVVIDASDDVVLTLLGKPVEGFSDDQMLKVWRQAESHVPPFCWKHNGNDLALVSKADALDPISFNLFSSIIVQVLCFT